MPIPSDASKDNCDSIDDDPKQALLVDLAGAIDTINALLAHLRAEGVWLSANNTFTADQKLRKSDDGSGVGPTLTLERVSASPAAADSLGRVLVSGRNSVGSATAYAAITGLIVDPTSGSERGRWDFDTIVAGSGATRMRLGAGLVLGSPTDDDKGTGTINATAIYDDGVQLFGPRAVVKLTGLTTTPTITTVFNSLGTLSASRTSTGVYTFSWTTSLTNPTVQLTVRRSTNTAFVFMSAVSGTSVTIKVVSPDTSPLDPDEVAVSIYG